MADRIREAAVFCACIALFVGCDKHKPVGAVGPNDEISVLTNTSPNGAVSEKLREIFAYPVEVAGKENAFRLDFVPFSRFRIHRHVKNQIFAVNLSGGDDLARALPGMLSRVAEDKLLRKEPFQLLVRDFWATGQSTMFFVAWSAADLEELVVKNPIPALRKRYEDSVVRGLTKTMFSLGEEKAIAAEVARQYGWSMRLTVGFFAANDPKGQVVKFNAGDPVRLILVHWQDGELPLNAETWNPLLSQTLKKYNDEDFFMPERTRIFPDTFQDRPSLKWEGIWQNDKYVIGGPFRAFACHRDGKSFLLVGIVFAPGQDKVYALRQIEALLKTFQLVT